MDVLLGVLPGENLFPLTNVAVKICEKVAITAVASVELKFVQD